MYSAIPLVHGFPGKSRSHGAFGWSSLWLLQDDERRVLVDTGPPSYIPLIHSGLASAGLSAADITDVVVTHLHWDHVSNFTVFPNATTWVGEDELAWASTLPAGTQFSPDLHIQELLRRGDGVGRIRPGREVLPGIHVIASPGHTPGHLALTADTTTGTFIFAGDAVKNVNELRTLNVEFTMSEADSRRSVQRLRALLRDTNGLLIPGHDVPLRADGNGFARVQGQVAQIGYIDDEGEVDRSIGDRTLDSNTTEEA
ncbi:N-acyl homoserine lactonase family protein [Diaminobutyricibacter tongyongensis]|uniref:N-acyl homoserine lactonase family protein n=1 Tax=Leifsonia tongyongensis TaxID=1268043 RepID=A0A6L9Y322_9MICO|nr:N-acyl homoserine lactonase family protein [Diaminobutyricibacter tongyongensis]NEN07674.1 N-acyl homoserine lactonase family protein [Diaminobutyricibacter tongyongensis]